jgi:DNA-directed RNA polymerase specialized sigma24 family protein
MDSFTILKNKLLKSLSNNEIVDLVYKTHHKWLMQVAYNFTQDQDNAIDLVQELYVYLLEMKDINKIRYNNTVNLFYLYKSLKSKFLNSIKQNKKIQILPIEEDFLEIEDQEYNYDKDEEFEVMLQATKSLLDKDLHWFDAKLLQTYINEDHSIASLHRATGISKSSIWTSLDKSRKFIKNSYEQRVTFKHEEDNSKNGG